MGAKIKVILLERIPRLGALGDEVSVAAGYARNRLLRYDLAVPATEQHRKEFESRRQELEKSQTDKLEAAKAVAKGMEGLKLKMQVSAAPSGKLFGSVGPRELAQVLKERDMDFERRDILLSGAIRELGVYLFRIQLHAQVQVEVEVELVAGSEESSLLVEEADSAS
ncbi:MAG: 50S ribosomal protein L9 [Gammaproteobacteria bacterium]